MVDADLEVLEASGESLLGEASSQDRHGRTGHRDHQHPGRHPARPADPAAEDPDQDHRQPCRQADPAAPREGHHHGVAHQRRGQHPEPAPSPTARGDHLDRQEREGEGQEGLDVGPTRVHIGEGPGDPEDVLEIPESDEDVALPEHHDRDQGEPGHQALREKILGLFEPGRR